MSTQAYACLGARAAIPIYMAARRNERLNIPTKSPQGFPPLAPAFPQRSIGVSGVSWVKRASMTSMTLLLGACMLRKMTRHVGHPERRPHRTANVRLHISAVSSCFLLTYHIIIHPITGTPNTAMLFPHPSPTECGTLLVGPQEVGVVHLVCNRLCYSTWVVHVWTSTRR